MVLLNPNLYEQLEPHQWHNIWSDTILDDSSSSEKVEFLRECAKLLRQYRTQSYKRLWGSQVAAAWRNIPMIHMEDVVKYLLFSLQYWLETDLVSEKDYIMGTALQGWFAGRIEQENIQELLTKVKFSNAYPCIDDKVFFSQCLKLYQCGRMKRKFTQADGYRRWVEAIHQKQVLGLFPMKSPQRGY